MEINMHYNGFKVSLSKNAFPLVYIYSRGKINLQSSEFGTMYDVPEHIPSPTYK